MQRTELSMAFFFLALLCWYPSECEAAAEARDALDICYHTPNHIFTVYTPWFQFSFDSGHNIIGFSVVLLWPTISFSWFSLNSGIKKFFTFFSKLTWIAIKLVSFALNFFQRKNWNGKIEKESQQELTIHCLNWMSVYACASECVRASILNVETVVFWVFHVGTVATLHTAKTSHRLSVRMRVDINKLSTQRR